MSNAYFKIESFLVLHKRNLSNAHFFALSATAGKYPRFQQDLQKKGP